MQRPVLVSVDVELDDGEVAVEVVLERDGMRATGRADGSAGASHRPRVVGEATLRSLETLMGDGVFELSAVGTSSLGRAVIALAQVRDLARSGSLVGSAMVREGDSVLATARAVLDAVNRRLLPSRPGGESPARRHEP